MQSKSDLWNYFERQTITMTILRIVPLTLKAASLRGVNPMPDMKNVSYIHAKFATTENVTEEDKKWFGKGTIGTLLPYLSQDDYDRNLRDTVYQAAILENDHMRATFLPELGGRLWSLYHKKLNRELLYVNDAVQPCNLALRNAWVAGGVEWNEGIKGHSPFTGETLFTAKSENQSGEPILTMYEFDRIRGTVFGINALLEEDRLYIRITIENRQDKPTYTYWWSNIAVPEKGVRVLTDAQQMFSCVYQDNHYTIDRIEAPYFEGKEMSYPENAPYAGDLFFITKDSSRKWITSLESDGIGLLQYSTPELIGRKMFFWGEGPGGRNWNRFLTNSDRGYIEIQAGLLRTQMEHCIIPENTCWSWTECYTVAQMNNSVMTASWKDATAEMADYVMSLPDPGMVDIPLAQPKQLLINGSGWGALEGREISRFYNFNHTSLGIEQAPWLHLKQQGFLPEGDPQIPPISYYTDPAVLAALEASLENPKADHWTTYLHIGILRYTLTDIAGAKTAWEYSCERTDTPWARRNLAMLYKTELNQPQEAVDHIQKAVALCKTPCRGLLLDCAMIMTGCGASAGWIAIYQGLPETLQRNGRLQLYTVIAYMNCGDTEKAKEILNESFTMTDIKEGELSISSIWTQLYGEETKLPKHLNFRMHDKKE